MTETQEDSHQFSYALLEDVKDSVTGFQGLIITCAQYLTGCDRYLVQPRKLDQNTGAPQEPQWFAEWRLLRIKAKRGNTVIVSTPLGSTAKDKLTGFEGIAVCRTCSPSSANHISLAKRDPTNMKDERDWLDFDESRLEVSSKKPITLTDTEKPGKQPGGPCSHPAPRN